MAAPFPKKGTPCCGVKRPWGGRLGKEDNGQAGVFLRVAARGGHAPLDCRLSLPKDWVDDTKRRQPCHVPQKIPFQEKGRIALDLIDRCRAAVPHGWVAAEDACGRVLALRAPRRDRQER